MLRSSHLIAAVVTVVAVFLFMVIRPITGIQFGLRTFWPGFVCLYLVVWYYVGVVGSRVNVERGK